MAVRIVQDALEEFGRMRCDFGPLRTTVSEPWHYREIQEKRIPFESDYGIYLLSNPVEPDWRVPLEVNESDLWYVGKSAGDIGGRIWKHLGNAYNPDTGQRYDPPCKAHDWADSKHVDVEIRDSIANGNLVVYAIRLDFSEGMTEAQRRLLPEVLEKHVLVRYFLAYGQLPPLNFQF